MRGPRNKKLSNGLPVCWLMYPSVTVLSLGESMHTISAAIVASTILIPPAFGHDNLERHDNAHEHNFQRAPGPIAGAGLPFLAVGYGVDWLVKCSCKANGSEAP